TATDRVAKAGDTMTGGLTLSAGSVVCQKGYLQVQGVVGTPNSGKLFIDADASAATGTASNEIQFRDSGSRLMASLQVTENGALVGGNEAATFRLNTMNGGYGLQEVFETVVASPPRTIWNGALSAPAFNVSSDETLKDDITPVTDVSAQFEALQPV